MESSLPRVSVSVEDRIILHLFEHIEEEDHFIVSKEITRPGIAEACALHPPNVSRSIKSLERRGLVEGRSATVKGESRRQKAWKRRIF